MEPITHVRVLSDSPYNWADEPGEATGEWPDRAVDDDATPFPWRVMHALGFSVGLVLFAIGLSVAVTVPPGQPWHGLIGLATATAGAGLTILALGNVHAEQRRQLR